jgi:hypothetical protein
METISTMEILAMIIGGATLLVMGIGIWSLGWHD